MILLLLKKNDVTGHFTNYRITCSLQSQIKIMFFLIGIYNLCHDQLLQLHMTGFRKINLKATSIVLNFFLSVGCKRPQGQRPQN